MNKKEMLEKSISKIGEYLRFGSKPGLERVSDLLDRLGNPHKNLKVIHVGGTNGKGSVCRYVYSVLQKAGYKTGLFISPYIEEFTERIEFDGKQIDPEDLWIHVQKATAAAASMVEEGLESPTEFEVLTAVMFSYFEEKKPDIVVLEVGLGGRGDSTNVVDKPLAVGISSISYDHMNVLGNTLVEIAGEKAGIIKKESPLVYASTNKGVISVIEGRAKELGLQPLNIHSLDIKEEEENNTFSFTINKKNYNNIVTGMHGKHQIMNAVCAICLIEATGLSVSDSAIREGIKEARQPGRIEVFLNEKYNDVTVVVDGSHNEDSVRVLTEWTAATFGSEKKILVVSGILADKEKLKIADLLCGISENFIVTEPDNPRRLAAEEYMEVIKSAAGKNIDISIIRNPEEACIEALLRMEGINDVAIPSCEISSVKKSDENCDKNERFKVLIFTGSLYMMGDIRRTLRKAGWRSDI